jgi:hypothetical protein
VSARHRRAAQSFRFEHSKKLKILTGKASARTLKAQPECERGFARHAAFDGLVGGLRALQKGFQRIDIQPFDPRRRGISGSAKARMISVPNPNKTAEQS